MPMMNNKDRQSCRCKDCVEHRSSTGTIAMTCEKISEPQRTIPHKCPVCDGSGKVSRPPWIASDVAGWPAASTGELYACTACNASGVVWS